MTVSAPTVATTGVAIPVSSISATISGSLAASGPITIYAYFGATNPATCPGGAGWTTVGTVTPSGDGTYNPSGGLASPATGTYWWYASFAGDSTEQREEHALQHRCDDEDDGCRLLGRGQLREDARHRP